MTGPWTAFRPDHRGSATAFRPVTPARIQGRRETQHRIGGDVLRGKHIGVTALTAGALTLVTAGALTLATAGTAEASRRCGPTSKTDGVGSLGTSWTLKSMHDDDGPGGTFVVGEEFEIATQVANQVWTITFADNGLVFFTADDTSTVTGIREV